MVPGQVHEEGTRLETVIILTSRMEQLARFYHEGLGLGPYESSPSHLGQQLGQIYFGFDQLERDPSGTDARVTLWFTVDDLQETFDRLVSIGAKVGFPPTLKPWGAVLASVYDPDGNLLGLAQRHPQEVGA